MDHKLSTQFKLSDKKKSSILSQCVEYSNNRTQAFWFLHFGAKRHTVIQSAPIYKCIEINSTFLLVPSKKRHLNIFPLPYNDFISEMTWPQVTEIEIPRYTFCRNWCLHQLLKVSYWYHTKRSQCAIMNIFEVRSLDLTWHDLGLNFYVRVRN